MQWKKLKTESKGFAESSRDHEADGNDRSETKGVSDPIHCFRSEAETPTLLAGSEEPHNGRIDVSGRGVTRRRHVDLRQNALMVQYGLEWSLESQIWKTRKGSVRK